MNVARSVLLLRGVAWVPLITTGVSVVVLCLLAHPAATLDERMLAVILRCGALLLGAGIAFGLVDPASGLVAATPWPRPRREGQKLVALATTGFAVWLACWGMTSRGFGSAIESRVNGLIPEAIVLMLLPAALMVTLDRRLPGVAAAAAATGVVLLAVVGTLPIRDVVWPNPTDDNWVSTRLLWWFVGVVPVLLIALGIRTRRSGAA